jgi:hypothetical protein
LVYLVKHRFPAQEHVGGDCKIPSIICYDREGDLQAVGAEATQENIQEEIEDNGWVKLEWSVLTTATRRLLTLRRKKVEASSSS